MNRARSFVYGSMVGMDFEYPVRAKKIPPLGRDHGYSVTVELAPCDLEPVHDAPHIHAGVVPVSFLDAALEVRIAD